MARKLYRYIEWMSRGRLTGRIAYTMQPELLPGPWPGAEWQLDHHFSAVEALQRRPALKRTIHRAVYYGLALTGESDLCRGPA